MNSLFTLSTLSRGCVASVALATLASLFPLSASATTILRMDAAGLVDGAELIFVGTAVHSETVTSEDGTFPYTLVTFTVDETLKGATAQATVTLELAGGSLETEIVEIPGMPRFDVGATYLLFARGNGTGPCPLLGWKQGMFEIARDGASGAPQVVDERGAPIVGLAAGRFVRGAPTRGADADVHYLDGSGIELLEVDGLTIDPVVPGAAAAVAFKATPTPGALLAELRSFIDQRQGQPSFKAGVVMPSADPATPRYGLGAPAGLPVRAVLGKTSPSPSR